MPMSTLAAFEGMSIDHDTLDKLAARWRERTEHGPHAAAHGAS